VSSAALGVAAVCGGQTGAIAKVKLGQECSSHRQCRRYADEFERAFLAQTEAFYHDEAADVLGRSGSGGSTVEFLKYAERRIAEEHAVRAKESSG